MFDLLSEIQKGNNYRLLFPDRHVGLAIMWLYDKSAKGDFTNGYFKESDIHEAFKAVVANKERHLWEYYNTVIADLQEYFLRYDDEKQLYSLKEYAIAFCQSAALILKANFDPTRIEKICIELRQNLESKIKGRLAEWFDVYFNPFRPLLKQQIDFLDRQIDHSVAELRLNTTLSNEKALEALKKIDHRFDEIRKHNKELVAAFREIDKIKILLQTEAMNSHSPVLGDQIFESIDFFREMKYLLTVVDARLDRIQPKIKQLFSSLNKPLMNVRVEKFLRLLLRDSVVRSAGKRKSLYLPIGVPQVSVRRQTPQFTIVERRKDLFPAEKKERVKPYEDTYEKTSAYHKSRNKILQQDEVFFWTERIAEELKQNNRVLFSTFFFSILKLQTTNSLELAVQVAYRVIRNYSLNTYWKMNVVQHPVSDETIKGITIWEITLEKA